MYNISNMIENLKRRKINKFVNDTSGEIWEKSDSQNYDRYVTLIVGDKHYTYYFKRVWE